MKLYYVHGIGSSGGGNTVELLKKYYPDYEIISDDIPTDPIAAFMTIKKNTRDCDIVIGTSLGGFYTMMLSGCFKIIINPAMIADEDIKSAIGIGTHDFLRPRKTGETTYTVDEKYIEDLKYLRERFFTEWFDEDYRFETYGVFGTEDTVVNRQETFKKYYGSTRFYTGTFGHRITEEAFVELVKPIIDKIAGEK